MAIQRLSVRDTVNLYWGDGDPGGVLLGWVAMVDRQKLHAADDAEAVRLITSAISSHVVRLPRLRQRVQPVPFGLGLPIWRDDEHFTIARHVGSRAVAAPGGPSEVHAAVEQIFAQPLPRDRPLWHIEILTGLADDQLALVQRVHHALADGVAAAMIAGALLDGDAVDVSPLPPPAPPPGARELLVDAAQWRARTLWGAGRALARPATVGRRLRKLVHEAVTLLRRTRDRPPTQLNRPVGPRRATHVVEVPLAAVRQAGHCAGATVNDVLLAAVGGGLRALLAARGEAVDAAIMYASVPVSVRTGSPAVLGNRTAGLLVDVRVDEPDDRRRLVAIARDTAWQKQHEAWVGLMGFMDSPWVPAWFHRRATRMLRNQRMINVMVSNVPGPPSPLRIAGAPIHTIFPLLPIAVNVPLGVAAVSYAGRFVLGVRTDPDLVPDVETFLSGLNGSLDALGVARPVAA